MRISDWSSDVCSSDLIVGATQSIPYNVEVISNYYHDDLTFMPEAQGVAKRLWAMTGLSPSDMQIAAIYVEFTPQVLLQLVAFGFCKPCEGREGSEERRVGQKIGGRDR